MFCVDLVYVDAYFCCTHRAKCLEVSDIDCVIIYAGGAPFGVVAVSFIVHFVYFLLAKQYTPMLHAPFLMLSFILLVDMAFEARRLWLLQWPLVFSCGLGGELKILAQSPMVPWLRGTNRG